jgi:hypothetical protein
MSIARRMAKGTTDFLNGLNMLGGIENEKGKERAFHRWNPP